MSITFATRQCLQAATAVHHTPLSSAAIQSISTSSSSAGHLKKLLVHLIKAYKTTKMDSELKLELKVWREEQAVRVLGRMMVQKWGEILFMSDEIIQQIVDCAHGQKITTTDHIVKETCWRRDYVDQCMESLIALIKKHMPPPPPLVLPPPPLLPS